MNHNNISPKLFLQDLVGHNVIVRLKWGNEYRGTLQSYDAYFNVKLANAFEYVNMKEAGKLGDVLIRCNNIMIVREVEH